MGAFHSNGHSPKSGVAGNFHRPYETQENFTFLHAPQGLLQKLFLQQPYFYALQVVLGYADIVLPQFKRPL